MPQSRRDCGGSGGYASYEAGNGDDHRKPRGGTRPRRWAAVMVAAEARLHSASNAFSSWSNPGVADQTAPITTPGDAL